MNWLPRPYFALAAVVLAFAVVAVADGVSAQSRSPSSASLDAAKKQMERGQDLYAQKRYAEAADAFAAAYATEPYAAFLYNEAVCNQKLGRYDRALELFRKYIAVDPNAPDADQTRARIARIEATIAAPSDRDAAPAVSPDADADAAVPDGAATPAPAVEEDPVEMKSLVIIESEPAGAPVSVYSRSPSAARFAPGQQNPGWTRVVSGSTPLHVTLDVGRYHIVIEPFADFHLSDTDMDVAAGHVHQFKANLRQGEFLAFLRVTSPQRDARIYLDDPPPHRRPPWGTAPHEGLVGVGEHRIWVERAGFATTSRTFVVTHGQQLEELVELKRLARGTLRFDGNAAEISIEIDGRPAGLVRTGSPLDVELASGPHELVASAADRKTLQTTVNVPRGVILPVDLVMMPKTPRGAAWTQAVVSAAFLGGGVFLGLRSNATYDDLASDRRAGTLTDDDDRYTRGKLYSIGADACFGISGVLAAVSTYNFIKDPTPPSVTRLGAPFDPPDMEPNPSAPRPRRGAVSFPAMPRPSPTEERNVETIRLLPLAGPATGQLLIDWRF